MSSYTDGKLKNMNPSCGQFHQRFTCAFFVRKFVQSQNVTRKKAFVQKGVQKNFDKIDTWSKAFTASGSILSVEA